MSSIPSVVIGLGTTGCEIAAQVYKNYKFYCEETGEHPGAIQFLLLDTNDPPYGAEELNARGEHFNFGFASGEELNPGNITQALQSTASLQVKKDIKPIILDYDQTNVRLNVVDKSFFLIWLG